MSKSKRSTRSRRLKQVLLLGALAIAAQAHAGISLALDQTSVTTPAGATLQFTGVITNQSGGTLTADDFFLNFFSFDPTAIDPEQVLGSIAFTLPNNTYSGHLALFTVALSPGLAAGAQTLGVTLEDLNSDISNEVDIVMNVTSNASPAPEPGAASLLALGLAALGAWRRLAAARVKEFTS